MTMDETHSLRIEGQDANLFARTDNLNVVPFGVLSDEIVPELRGIGHAAYRHRYSPAFTQFARPFLRNYKRTTGCMFGA